MNNLHEGVLALKKGFKFKKWGYLFPLVLGLLLSGFQLFRWDKAQNLKYVAPSFKELKVNEGVLSFTNRWRSTGGAIVILSKDGSKLNLSCSGPFSDNACFRIYEDGKWLDRQKDFIGENATVWWHPENNSSDYGRIYQLKVKDELVYTYNQKADEYIKDYNKGPQNYYKQAIIYFIMLVPFSIYKLVKENK